MSRWSIGGQGRGDEEATVATVMRPLQIGVADLRSRPGSRRLVERSIVSEGAATSSAAVAPGTEVAVSVEIEAVAGGVVATGSIRMAWTGACRRCLEEIEGEVEVSVREVFEERPTEGETYPLRDDVVDLEPMVNDALLLALPLAPLCRPDCSGPAPDAFPTGPTAAAPSDPETSDPPTDPRWAALEDLHFD